MLVELNYKKEGRKRGEKGKRKKGEQEDGGKERETDQSVTAPGLVLCFCFIVAVFSVLLSLTWSAVGTLSFRPVLTAYLFFLFLR